MEQGKKSEAIRKVLDEISLKSFGRKRSESINNQVCVPCGKDASNFRDEISRKEYSISGMCQECQDKMFHQED